MICIIAKLENIDVWRSYCSPTGVKLKPLPRRTHIYKQYFTSLCSRYKFLVILWYRLYLAFLLQMVTIICEGKYLVHIIIYKNVYTMTLVRFNWNDSLVFASTTSIKAYHINFHIIMYKFSVHNFVHLATTHLWIIYLFWYSYEQYLVTLSCLSKV